MVPDAPEQGRGARRGAEGLPRGAEAVRGDGEPRRARELGFILLSIVFLVVHIVYETFEFVVRKYH